MAKEETKHLAQKQMEAAIKLLKAANGQEEKIMLLRQKVGELYENILVIFKEADIPWGQMTREIQLGFGNWPKTEKGEFIGTKALLEDKDEQGRVKYEPAVWLNRFNVYRNRYTSYGKTREAPPARVPIASLPPEQRAEARVKESVKETEKRISTAHAVNFELVVQALRELLTFSRQTGNKQAEAPIMAVAKAFGIAPDAIFELKSVVIPKEGKPIIPPELQQEPEPQVVH
jgi:hypothetical protein